MRLQILACLGALISPALITGGVEARPVAHVETVIRLPGEVDAAKIRELSGLAYDPKQDILWAVSDRGELRGFKITYANGRPIAAHLRHSADLRSTLKSAEGLALVPPALGKTEPRLLVVYEDGPAAVSFALNGGDPIAVKLPAPLDRIDAYAEPNSRLEAVAVDRNGILLTAPEEALAGTPDTVHTIYFADGRRLTFATFQPHRSNIKAIEVLPDNRLLILERTRDTAGQSTMRLRLIDPAACAKTGECVPQELTPDRNLAFEGNFEGLTRLHGNFFAAVTDSKPKDGEETVLVIFELR